jgi:hypothetical protein
MLLQPGRVQRSLLVDDGKPHEGSEDLSGAFRRELYLYSTCPVSNLARIARKTNPLRNMVWLSLVCRFEIRHLIHHDASSVDREHTFEVEESFTHEYVRAQRGQTSSGKDPANFASHAPRHVAPRRAGRGDPRCSDARKCFWEACNRDSYLDVANVRFDLLR